MGGDKHSTTSSSAENNEVNIVSYDVCLVPNTCNDEKNFEQCTDLVDSGCEFIITSKSCPPIYRCRDVDPEDTDEDEGDNGDLTESNSEDVDHSRCPEKTEPCM